jgi:hypothetical protein
VSEPLGSQWLFGAATTLIKGIFYDKNLGIKRLHRKLGKIPLNPMIPKSRGGGEGAGVQNTGMQHPGFSK